ncbi:MULTISPECIES: Rv3235 family protein [Pseudonocardia]|uniref:Rv3235 family protein n=1 Tax=Pseudonocardia TaxID=1847 RepID=UPI000F79B3F5|nr:MULTISPECIES: Rv3235 family protein [Pseudonocardia]
MTASTPPPSAPTVPAPRLPPAADDAPGAGAGGVLVARTAEEVPVDLPPGLVVVLPGGFRMRSGASPRRDPPEPPRVQVRPPGTTAPDAARTRARAAELVRLVREVLAGNRPAGQLAGVAAPPVLRYLRTAHPAPHRRRPAGRARAPGCGAHPDGPRRGYPLHVGQPHPDAAEICATVALAGRVRALTLRIDRTGGDTPWVVTAARLL